MSSRTRILFDTDPGIDDAMALAMLARDPRAELVGITTVFGNGPIEQTTRNALSLRERFGLAEVPVARGAARPLVREPAPFAAHVHGRNGLGDVAVPDPVLPLDPRPAARFIVDMVHRHPGELVLVPVGPLTNLAEALRLDPALPVMRAIGVPEIAGYLRGDWSLEEARIRGSQATRNYAKRQFTWFRRQPPEDWPRAENEPSIQTAMNDILLRI